MRALYKQIVLLLLFRLADVINIRESERLLLAMKNDPSN